MDTTQKRKDIKSKINELYAIDIQKKLIFMKQRYYEIGSKSARLLAYKLKKQQAERVIYKIKDPTTKKVKYKIQEILSSFEKYYKNLYSQRSHK